VCFAHEFLRRVTPAFTLGLISLAVLGVAIVARYLMHLARRKIYVVAACTALYFNVFVLVVQSFAKVSMLNALAPT
jgi:hypothetical protein